MHHRIRNKFSDLANHDAAAGIMMLLFTIIALAYQNSPYAYDYRTWLETRAGLVFGSFELIKPLLLWINDGIITIFFFSIGLELKHEFMEGQLANKKNILLPAAAALGGMLFPALIFTLFNFGDPYIMRGWAIPTATDTAFSVGILLLLGKRVPSSLKIFLLSLAIFDDVGAIVVIALFYTSQLSSLALAGAGIAIVILALLNYFHINRKSIYWVVGLFLWFSILKSGVHATLAGIITAFFIPLKKNNGEPLVQEIFERLRAWIALLILPLFVFANAGIDLHGIDLSMVCSNVSLGILLGLFVGKQLGVFGCALLCIKLGLAPMPQGANARQLYGVCILTGIGFTMSMFIDGLAYSGSDIFNYADSLAILLGSLISGVVGYLFLRFFAGNAAQNQPTEAAQSVDPTSAVATQSEVTAPTTATAITTASKADSNGDTLAQNTCGAKIETT